MTYADNSFGDQTILRGYRLHQSEDEITLQGKPRRTPHLLSYKANKDTYRKPLEDNNWGEAVEFSLGEKKFDVYIKNSCPYKTGCDFQGTTSDSYDDENDKIIKTTSECT